MRDVFPPSWFVPALLELVLDFVSMLPIDAEGRKRVFASWAEESGVELEGWMVERVTGAPAGEV